MVIKLYACMGTRACSQQATTIRFQCVWGLGKMGGQAVRSTWSVAKLSAAGTADSRWWRCVLFDQYVGVMHITSESITVVTDYLCY